MSTFVRYITRRLTTNLAFEKVFIYLCILALMFVAFGIRHAGWSMYQGYLTVFFAFMKNCLLVVIISWIWDVVFILCFRGASGGSTLLTLAFPCINGVTKVTQHHMRGYGHPNFFGCIVRVNPWCVDFISGISSCENQPCFGWLIVELFSLLQVKISLIRNLLFVAYSILMGCYVLWPSLLLL